MDEHITIIHGPNGFGKTVMLKLLRALFGQSPHLLQKVLFDEFRVDFEDNSSFWVSKTPPSHELTKEEYSEKQEIVFALLRLSAC
jgi:predicted ATP-binding protein involved in virulence